MCGTCEVDRAVEQVRVLAWGSARLSWRLSGGCGCGPVVRGNVRSGQPRERRSQKSPFPARNGSPRGVRRLAVRGGWLRHHLYPPAGAFPYVRVVHPCALAVVPVVLCRGRWRLDVFCGCRLDHYGRRGIVGVGHSPPTGPPPPQATPNDDPRAPMPPTATAVDAAAPPRASRMPPTTHPMTSHVRASAHPRTAHVRPTAPAVDPTPATVRRLGGEGTASHQQSYHHARPGQVLHGQSLHAVLACCLGLLPVLAAPSRAARPVDRCSSPSRGEGSPSG